MWFEAYPKSHFVTVSNYINSLADYIGWSTIKTLPATLPEPSGGLLGLILKGEVYIQEPGPWSERRAAWSADHGYWVVKIIGG